MNSLASLLVCLGSVAVIVTLKFLTNKNEGIVHSGEQDFLLLVGIVSSRGNFEARESLRNTWMKTINTSLEKCHFLVGNKFCLIPTTDRLSEYSCEEWIVTVPNDINTNTEFESSNIKENFSKILDPELRIHVHHSIVIRRLCILSDFIKKLTKISLVDLASNEIIVSASITNPSNINNSLICKSVEFFNFPKHFEGRIIMDPSPSEMFKCSVGVTDMSQLVTYTGSKKQLGINDICSPVSLIYTAQDVKSLNEHLSGKKKRVENWILQQNNDQSLLIEESKKFQDIIFLDVIDVYRNLPLKILQFFKWSEDHKIKFQYLLKTDDDTFIDLKKVRNKLLSVSSSNTNWWWSSFREGWPVQRCGKWREDSYISETYPPFPCGAGYVLSADLVHYLASNAERLYCYQGEDVSMGIWLAPLHPKLHSDCWQCSTCVPHACNRPQLTVDEVYHTWRLYLNSSDFCS